MDSVKLAAFLHNHVANTIAQKAYIKSVALSFYRNESFGNDYITISYLPEFNEKFDGLPAKERISILKSMEGTLQYTYSLSTNSNRVKANTKFRILEFKHVYTSLASYVTMQLEANLLAEIPLKIQGVDYDPDINYTERNLIEVFEYHNDFRYEKDRSQYKKLQELAINSRGIFDEQRNFFGVTDYELENLNFLTLTSIRDIVLSYQVPIKTKGVKTINEIYIHVSMFVEALRKEYQTEKAGGGDQYRHGTVFRLKQLIEHLYDTYLVVEKNRLTEQQREMFVGALPFEEGDVLELKDGRLVLMESVIINENNDIDICYCMLKNDFQKSVRRRIVRIEQVSFYLKRCYFDAYKSESPIKRLSLLEGWMKKRKVKVMDLTFQPDLITNIIAK